ncbi:MAG: phage tail tube protein [Leptolyngbyaceae bacterium]|nr:phage tail tube protein [Leptolyngbyaceae bacterium]
MAIVNGNKIGVYVNNQLIGCLTSNSFSSTNEEIDVTCKDNDGARQVLPGGNTAEITFEGNFDPASTYGFDDLLSVHKNKTRVGIKYAQSGSGGLYIQGYAYLNSLTWDGPLNAATTFSGTFNVDGVWTYATTT